MGLTKTNRDSGHESYLPTNGDLVKVAEVATERESSAYAVDSFVKVIQKAGKAMQAAAKGMLETLIINRDLKAGNLVNTADCWIKAIAPTRTMSVGAETKALCKALRKHNLKNIKIDFAISESSEFKRAFTSNDNTLKSAADNLLNDLLLLFFKSKGISVEIKDQGSFLRDVQGKLVNPEQTRAIIADPDTGFHAYLRQHGIQANIKAHPFPGEAPISKRTPAPAVAAPVAPAHGGEEAPTPS